MSAEILAHGKTKDIVAGPTPGSVLLVAKDRLTGGDAAKVAEVADIGRHKTRQAALAFACLRREGVPSAYLGQPAADRLHCRDCRMIPLEFVVRRFAYGSYLKRNPDLAEARPPHRFPQPVWEVFHKHTVVTPPLVPAVTLMSENEARDRFLGDGGWPAETHTDPLVDVRADGWALFSAKHPPRDPPLTMVPPVLDGTDLSRAIETIVMPTFLLLERAWAGVDTRYGPVSLVDMKVELGMDTETGDLLLADVIDNDSWRIWPGGNPSHQLDKQAFRDGAPEAEISAKYELVTRLMERHWTAGDTP